MAKRGYNQYCSAATALDVLGERWTLLIIRDLLTGPKRYTDLLNGLPGIGTNLLASRLKDLEAADVVRRTELPPPAASTVYELTPRGAELEDVVVGLARWGLSLLGSRNAKQAWRPEWSTLALQARFQPRLAEGVDERYQFVIDGEPFFAAVRDGRVETGSGHTDLPAFTVRADAAAFLAVADGSMALDDAIASGRYEIDGDADAFGRCVAIFSPLPE